MNDKTIADLVRTLFSALFGIAKEKGCIAVRDVDSAVDSCVMLCCDPETSLMQLHYHAHRADDSLRLMNRAAVLPLNPCTLALYVDGCHGFGNEACYLDRITCAALPKLRGTLMMSCRTENDLEELKGHLADNIRERVAYVFECVDMAWMEVKRCMRLLMDMLSHMIDSLYDALTTNAPMAEGEKYEREQEYRTVLDSRIELVDSRYRKMFLTQREAYGSVSAQLDWMEREFRSQIDCFNPFIKFNEHRDKTPRQMVSFMAGYRNQPDMREAMDGYFDFEAKMCWIDSLRDELDVDKTNVNMDKQDILDIIKQGGVVIDKFVAGDNIEGDKVGVKHEYQAGSQVTNHYHGADCKPAGEFDIDRFPASHFDFIRAVNDKERRETVMKMRQELVEEAERYEDMSRHKQEILNAVFVPRIQKDKVKDIPSHSILLDLFGDCIDGLAKKAHNEWKRELEWQYWHRKAKRRGC